jgi:hypothetical protein
MENGCHCSAREVSPDSINQQPSQSILSACRSARLAFAAASPPLAPLANQRQLIASTHHCVHGQRPPRNDSAARPPPPPPAMAPAAARAVATAVEMVCNMGRRISIDGVISRITDVSHQLQRDMAGSPDTETVAALDRWACISASSAHVPLCYVMDQTKLSSIWVNL